MNKNNLNLRNGKSEYFTYYHVSLVEDKISPKTFVPRIPNRSMDDEDTSISRICVAEEISGCIKAFPDKISFALCNDLMGSAYLFVYKVDMTKIGCENILYWNQIKDLVPDASSTKEAWITKEFTATPILVRFQENYYDYEPVDNNLYTDTIIGKDTLDFITSNFNIITYYKKEGYKDQYIIKYKTDEYTKDLWMVIAQSHLRQFNRKGYDEFMKELDKLVESY